MEPKKRGESAWSARVERWKKSGKSQRAFCLDEKLSFWSFRNWKARLAKSRREQRATSFVELPIREVEKPAQNYMMRITSPCGVVIEIGSGASIARIKAILQIARSV